MLRSCQGQARLKRKCVLKVPKLDIFSSSKSDLSREAASPRDFAYEMSLEGSLIRVRQPSQCIHALKRSREKLLYNGEDISMHA
jgi:hypothetical protein